MMHTLFTLPYDFHRTFNNYTGGQSVSFMLLWQPSDCINLFLIYCIFVSFSENKYDDDDDDDGVPNDGAYLSNAEVT